MPLGLDTILSLSCLGNGLINSNNLNTKIRKSWKHTLHETLYEADTPKGRIFNIVLFVTIIASIILVMLESVESFDTKYHDFLNIWLTF